MIIKKYSKLKAPCAMYDMNLGKSNDVVGVSDEEKIISVLLNKAIISLPSWKVDYLDLNEIPDLRSFIRSSILESAQNEFLFNESIHEYTSILFELGYDNVRPNITPDGLFLDLEDYDTWKKYYYKHPVKSDRSDVNEFISGELMKENI